MKGALYRAVFGNYDFRILREPYLPYIDKILFTDSESIRIPGYRRVLVHTDADGTIANRQLKILGHPALLDYDFSIYIDANIWITRDICDLTSDFLESGCPPRGVSPMRKETLFPVS